jgi:hypothetical protein
MKMVSLELVGALIGSLDRFCTFSRSLPRANRGLPRYGIDATMFPELGSIYFGSVCSSERTVPKRIEPDRSS